MSHHNTITWVDHIKFLRNQGIDVVSREKLHREKLGVTLHFGMEYPIIAAIHRKLNYSFMFAEAHWILSGSNRLADVIPFCKRMEEFSDDGFTLSGAYGPKFLSQVDYICQILNKDPGTRQAVMTFWEKCPNPSKDIPCTISLQFFIRNGFLHLSVHMRSSDAWLGLPYDIFNFTMMAIYVKLFLFQNYSKYYTLGELFFSFGSSHIYESDVEKIDEFLAQPLNIRKFNDVSFDFNITPDSLVNALGILRDAYKLS